MGINIPGQFYTEGIGVLCFKIYGLQKKIDLVDKYCRSLKLKFNLNKSKNSNF